MFVKLCTIGRPYMSNPDLVARFLNNWPLAETAPYNDWYNPPYEDPSKTMNNIYVDSMH